MNAQPVIAPGFFFPERPWLIRYQTNSIAARDLNGDNKADLSMGITPSSSLLQIQNASTPGVLGFSQSTNYPGGGGATCVAIGDLNNDGKPDVVTTDSASSIISVFHNGSLPSGSISFSWKDEHGGCINPTTVLLGDIDGDGKLDLVGISSTTNNLSFFRNTSTGLSIAFAPRTEITLSRTNQCGAAEDLDGDGKIDLVLVNRSQGIVSLLRNTSTVGNISFVAQTDLFPGSFSSACAVGDLDGDGRKEVCIAKKNAAIVSVYKNNSVVGSFSFAPHQDFFTNANPTDISIGDLDGNGKPEIVTCHPGSPNIAVLENISSGSISFAPKVGFVAGGNMSRCLNIVDIDGNGKRDIVTTSDFGNDTYICVLLSHNPSTPVLSCAGATISLSAAPGLTYQWQVNTGSGFTNLFDGNNYNGVNTPALQLINIPVTWSGYMYRCLVNGNPSTSYILDVGQSTPSSISISATGCLSSALTFTATASNAGTAPIYQWKRNGLAVGNNNPVYTSTNLASGDIITCQLTSNAPCTSQPNASSNSIVIEPSIPSITISISPTGVVCVGSALTFSATSIGGGTSPIYQWQKNGVPIGTNSPLFTSALLAHNDIITCTLVSNASCLTTNSASSNAIPVNMPPLASGSIAPATVPLCAGASQLLTCNSNSTSLQWLRDGAPILNATGATYLATEAGSYTVRFANGSCSVSESANASVVTITPLPVGTVAPASAAICAGSSEVLTASGGTTYQWSLNGIPVPGAIGATYAATQAGNYSVALTKDGCSAPASNGSFINLITAPAGSISPATATICAGTTQLLTASAPGANVQWYRDGVAISGATGNTYAASEGGIYSALLSTQFCSGAAANNALIAVRPLPTGTITPAQATLCPNIPQLLTATGGTSYQWSFNGIPIAGATTQTYSAENPGVYKVVASDGLCTAELITAASLVKGVVPPSVKYPLLRIAANKPYPLQARSGGQAYSWSPAADFNQATLPNPILTATQSREYLVTITPPTGCQYTDIQEVEVFSAPAVFVPSAFTPNGDGVNDVLRPLPVHFKEIKSFKVFNRWGVLVFETTLKDAGWDGRYGGKLQPFGTFVWLFEGTDIDGKLFREKGVSTLMR